MIFRPDLAEKVLDGRKTVTRRLCSQNPRSPWWREVCAFQVDRDYAVQAKRGTLAIGRIRIVAVRRETLIPMRIAGPVAVAEARREGFESVQAFQAAWVAINGSWDLLAEVWRVEFAAVSDADEGGDA